MATDDSRNSREVRVFLSSTFRDFDEERKLLATQVFPELNRRASARGVVLVEVDLRWGVTQEQAEDGHALEICLAEIERCRRYFIGMLGDSYGSLTPPERQLIQATPQLLERHEWLKGKIGQASYTELEIEQRLQQVDGITRDDHAFFYFRSPDYSTPRADAGEPGWRSDDPADRQKLERLQARIRRCGYPLVEGLASPQAIAERIKEDLWALIDREFPEEEQPAALQQEASKHADYRRKRTGVGQYIGGEVYVQKLENWLIAGKQQILITGAAGAGKSALIANWMEQHGQSHPEDELYAHHLGCTNDANAIRPLLGRLIDTASQQLLEAGVISEPLAVPEDWWELVARVEGTLQSLGCWCQQNGKRWILVLDGLDRLDPEDQKALPWLPLRIPKGVHVVASALACSAKEILDERSYTTLTIQPLAEKEQGQLIQQYLHRYTKELDAGLRQQILSHPLGSSPLFLRVLLEELRQCGRHDILKDQLAFYLSSQTIDDLYERVLERVENDGSGEAVKKVVTALWASRAGLTEPELLAITDLKPLQWAPIDLALEKAFGRNGNRLVFDHDYLRVAVQDRYLVEEDQQRKAHSGLADWFNAKENWDERDAEELPWQWQAAGELEALREHLLNPVHLAYLSFYRDERETINYWRAAQLEDDGELDELIAEAVENEIAERKEDASDQIWFVDQIADLLDEAGLYRDLLLRLRTLSLELEKTTKGRDEASIISSLAWLANAHRDMGHYEEAEPLYLRCLEARERLLGSEHPSTLNILGNLGLLYSEKGDYEQAESYYRRDLEASERLLGPEHPSTLISVGNLAGLYRDKGDYEEAEALYKRCLAAQERQLGPEHTSTLVTVANLAGLFRRKGDYQKAEYYYKRDLEASERLLGPEHPTTLTTIGNLGLLYSEKGDYQQAENFYQRDLEASERLLGPEHPSTLTTVGNLAGLYREKGDYKQAEKLYNRCLEARERLLGADHPSTINTLGSVGLLYRDMGDDQQAEAYYKRCLEGSERVMGPDDESTNTARFHLAELLSDQERYSESIPLRRQELAWCLKNSGETDQGTLTSVNGLAIDLREAGELRESEALFRQLLKLRQQVLHPSDFAIGRTLGGLAKTLEDAGKLEEAAVYRQKSLEHRIEHEGSKSWWANRNRLDLARILHKMKRSTEAELCLWQLAESIENIDDSDESLKDLREEAEELRIQIRKIAVQTTPVSNRKWLRSLWRRIIRRP